MEDNKEQDRLTIIYELIIKELEETPVNIENKDDEEMYAEMQNLKESLELHFNARNKRKEIDGGRIFMKLKEDFELVENIDSEGEEL